MRFSVKAIWAEMGMKIVRRIYRKKLRTELLEWIERKKAQIDRPDKSWDEAVKTGMDAVVEAIDFVCGYKE